MKKFFSASIEIELKNGETAAQAWKRYVGSDTKIPDGSVETKATEEEIKKLRDRYKLSNYSSGYFLNSCPEELEYFEKKPFGFIADNDDIYYTDSKSVLLHEINDLYNDGGKILVLRVNGKCHLKPKLKLCIKDASGENILLV
jgi:hypothetical protein